MPIQKINQDSFIAINEEAIVVDSCSTDGDVINWMEKHTGNHFLITSSSIAVDLIGHPLPDGDVEVMLL